MHILNWGDFLNVVFRLGLSSSNMLRTCLSRHVAFECELCLSGKSHTECKQIWCSQEEWQRSGERGYRRSSLIVPDFRQARQNLYIFCGPTHTHHCTTLQAKPFGPSSTFPTAVWTDAVTRATDVDSASLAMILWLGSRGRKIFFPWYQHQDPSSQTDTGSRIKYVGVTRYLLTKVAYVGKESPQVESTTADIATRDWATNTVGSHHQ